MSSRADGRRSEGHGMDEQTLRERTKRTAQMLFHTLKGGTGFELWKKFDKRLARELSMFFTGVLYSREVLSQKQRELCAVAALTALHRPNEVRAHIHAALNVGATRQEVAEAIFQQVTYGGMPVGVDALEERGEVTVGVIHNPVTAELYTARRGAGAFLNGERIRVSDVAELGRAFFLHAGLGIVRKGGHWDGFARLIDATDRQRGFGDYMGYGLVAEGKAEIYAELDLKPWDLAAPKILVEEAGGRFTDFAGRPTIYTGTALATNGRLHDAALALLSP